MADVMEVSAIEEELAPSWVENRFEDSEEGDDWEGNGEDADWEEDEDEWDDEEEDEWEEDDEWEDEEEWEEDDADSDDE